MARVRRDRFQRLRSWNRCMKLESACADPSITWQLLILWNRSIYHCNYHQTDLFLQLTCCCLMQGGRVVQKRADFLFLFWTSMPGVSIKCCATVHRFQQPVSFSHASNPLSGLDTHGRCKARGRTRASDRGTGGKDFSPLHNSLPHP